MFNKKAAKQYAYSLVQDGKYCFHQLNEDEKTILSGLVLENVPQIHAYEYISDADSKCELPYMLAKYMETRNRDLADNIIELLCKNAYNSMAKSIDELLEEQEAEFKFNQKFDQQSDGA